MKALWQDSQTKFIDRVVRSHDAELYAERSNNGYIAIYRQGRRFDSVYEVGSHKIVTFRDAPQFVFALTDNWATTGAPREWGSEVVLERLKKHDLHNNELLFAEIERSEELRAKRKENDLKNQNEAWLADNHGRFKRAFSDINTSCFDKSDRRRRRFDKSNEIKL